MISALQKVKDEPVYLAKTYTDINKFKKMSSSFTVNDSSPNVVDVSKILHNASLSIDNKIFSFFVTNGIQ